MALLLPHAPRDPKALYISSDPRYLEIAAYVERREGTGANELKAQSQLASTFHKMLKKCLAELQLTDDPRIRLKMFGELCDFFERHRKVLNPAPEAKAVPTFTRFCAGELLRPGHTQYAKDE